MPGVYISYPFCAQKCTYCNFASGVFPRELERDYVDALCCRDRARTDWPWQPETVYLGGGTPSRLEPARSGSNPGGNSWPALARSDHRSCAGRHHSGTSGRVGRARA